MSSIYLTNTDINLGTPVKVLCNTVTVSGIKNNQKKPDANGADIVEVQTQSYENFKYTLTGAYFTGEANTLTWDDVIILYKQRYDGTNYTTLNINYGTSNTLNGLSASTDIKVVLNTPSLSLSTSASKDAYRPQATLTFTETK